MLFRSPHWRDDARGVIAGLTSYVNKGHFARAALEATAFQTREVLDAMRADSGVDLQRLKVDGGMVVNELLMQFQADLLNARLLRPAVLDTTALGAAYLAALGAGILSDPADVVALWQFDKAFEGQSGEDEIQAHMARWARALDKA